MRPYENYQRIDVSTAEPIRLVVMLYEGAIKNLNQAKRLLTEDTQSASEKINKTLNIINYLRSVLNHEQGGEIAFNLERLYEYMRDKLSEAGIQKDAEKVQEVIGLLQILLEGWRGVAAGLSNSSIGPALPEVPPPSTTRLSMVG